MVRRNICAIEASQLVLQDAIDASDTIGRWDWDIPNDRLYADPLVALLFNVDPALAQHGVPLKYFLDGIHPEDREETSHVIAISAKTGRSYVQEYRVLSADRATRYVLARGLITLDHAGRSIRGTGVLIDITQNRVDETASAQAVHPLERAAEHCLAAHNALHDIPETLLRQMSAMLLLEVGRRLSKLKGDQHRARMN
ncbi:PAS domain-containing protein [Methylobacterium sp. Leaf94]|uniref:PAS domain-containing protein n=1 Tax=Methylobacterium sp. Leaf94 TaxID=1736250 RepID=UPI0009E73595|nr:PAS domain-containing protein [Methylobacterium sp. Leaf94]